MVRRYEHIMVRNLLLIVSLSALLAACCEPAHKDSQPVMIDSLFSQTASPDIDIYRMFIYQTKDSIPGYFPIYTFGIKNAGSQDDDFTLRIRYNGADVPAGFDITKRVPAGQTVLFRTPTPQGDSSAHYTYALSGIVIAANDSTPTMDYAYYGFTQSSKDSVKLRFLRPTLQVIYGAIDNGPEACNTPASTQDINIDQFPDK